MLQFWHREEHPHNPVFPVASYPNGNPLETIEQYDPAPVRLPNGEIWVYVKGTGPIYAWRSLDNSLTWELMNSGLPVISPTLGWEGTFTIEPVAVYDDVTDTIHLWYKAGSGTTWAWGHATAQGIDPLTFTKELLPIKTSAQLQTELGLSLPIYDTAISDVIKVDDTYYFYFYVSTGVPATTGQISIGYATGATWTDPTAQGLIFSVGPKDGLFNPHVFKYDSLYVMTYVYGSALQFVAEGNWRCVRVAVSSDPVHFGKIEPQGTVLEPIGTTWESGQVHSGRFLRNNASGEPILIDGKYQFYYSGQDFSPLASQGAIDYFTPVICRTPPLRIPASSSVVPKILFENINGVVKHGTICALSSSAGMDMLLGSNLFLSTDGLLTSFDPTAKAGGFRIHNGIVELVRGSNVVCQVLGPQEMPSTNGNGLFIAIGGPGSGTPLTGKGMILSGTNGQPLLTNNVYLNNTAELFVAVDSSIQSAGIGIAKQNVSISSFSAGQNPTRTSLGFFDGVNNRLGLGGMQTPLYPVHHQNGAKLSLGGTWTDSSSVSVKTNFADMSSINFFTQLESLPLKLWNYRTGGERRFGPVAEDFNSIFGLGDRESIAAADLGGLALFGVKELKRENEALGLRVQELENTVRLSLDHNQKGE